MTPEAERWADATSGAAPGVGAAGPDPSVPPVGGSGPLTLAAAERPRQAAASQSEVGPEAAGSGPTSQTSGSAVSQGKGPAGPDTPPRVIGLDLSLSSTGVADARDQIRLHTIRTGPGDNLADTHDRLIHIVREIADRSDAGFWLAPTLAVVEGPSYSSSGAGTWDRAGLWWLVVARLFDEAVPVAVVPPAALKRYATGKGNATKPDMRMALYQRAGLDERDDNKVDAWFLVAMGLDWLGHPPVKMPAANRAALEKVTWPEVPRG